MTSGRIYLKTNKNGWIESRQLLYDMVYDLPYGNGTKIISGFLRRQFESKKKLDYFVKTLYNDWDKDGYLVDDDDEMSFLTGQEQILEIKDLADDYSYILNCSSQRERIIVDGEYIMIDKNEMIILSFLRIDLRLSRHRGKVKLIFDADEVNICTEALDFYNRVFMGQYDNIISRLGWRMDHPADIFGFRNLYEHLLLSIRDIIMKDTDLGKYGLNASLGIWSEETDIRAINSYDIQQVMRYHLAYAVHPESGYTVDFRTPIIKGDLPEIGCDCQKKDGLYFEEITCTVKHLQILDDALLIFSLLHTMKIRKLFEYFTQDEVALDIAAILEKTFLRFEKDWDYINEIENVRKKVIFGGMCSI